MKWLRHNVSKLKVDGLWAAAQQKVENMLEHQLDKILVKCRSVFTKYYCDFVEQAWGMKLYICVRLVYSLTDLVNGWAAHLFLNWCFQMFGKMICWKAFANMTISFGYLFLVLKKFLLSLSIGRELHSNIIQKWDGRELNSLHENHPPSSIIKTSNHDYVNTL